MRTRMWMATASLAIISACAPKADVQPLLRDFDDYARDVKSVSTDPKVLDVLEGGQQKRDSAAALAEKGKSKESFPLAEEALADARFALEAERMKQAASRADACRLEVEQARTKWSEAVFVLEQTEEFVGKSSPDAKMDPIVEEEETSAFPATTIVGDSLPPADMGAITAQWNAWRKAASDHKVACGDLENAYRRGATAAGTEKADAAALAHQRYLASRAVQALECRVRADAADAVCLETTQQTAAYANSREGALRATLELERGLKDDIQRDLDHLRAEAKTRQEELRGALSQMEGKFASIRQDARGTIVSLADILFDFDKATLRRDVEFNLVKIATILNQFGEMNVLVEGHTDAIGTDEYNLQLSKKRAQAVNDFLVSQGVEAKRLSWEGYGKTRPVAENDTDENRQKNRRVDLVIQDASATKASN
jgi:outer membrane protein OmpA-like peptidoglycan-associated protein